MAQLESVRSSCYGFLYSMQKQSLRARLNSVYYLSIDYLREENSAIEEEVHCSQELKKHLHLRLHCHLGLYVQSRDSIVADGIPQRAYAHTLKKLQLVATTPRCTH